jgi:HEAT repeat protein
MNRISKLFLAFLPLLLLSQIGITISAAETPQTREAWNILVAGAHDKSFERRAEAIGSMDLLKNEPRAVAEAETALRDENSSVRVAAINVLAELNARASVPRIKTLVGTADGKTLLAIAAALKKFNDPEGYEIYYEILTGTRKTGGGLLAGLKDRKSLEKMGITEAIGFVPFGGVGLGAYDYLKQNQTANTSLMVGVALALAGDPDPATVHALVQSAFGDRDPVKVASLRALALHGDPAVISEIQPAMHSDKTIVSYTAAAAVLRLSARPRHRARPAR